MERTIAGLLARPLGLGTAKPRASRAHARASGRRRRARRTTAHPLAAGAAGLGAAAWHALDDRVSALWRIRRTRIALIAAAAAVLVIGGGYVVVRKTPLSAVSHVRVSGAHGAEAHAIEAALARASHGMSTLGVEEGALRAAVAPFRVVSDLHVSASFPHTLSITVVEQPPVAALTAAGGRTAVAADGVVLGPALLSSSLPTLETAATPAPGQLVSDSATREALTVLGAAPHALARHVSRAFRGPRGLTLQMGNGLQIYFGDASVPHAKWRSLIAVLSDPSSAGARYVDVRVPSRPAAGFGPGAAPPLAAGSTGDAGGSALEGSQASRIDKLAAALSEAGGVNTGSATGEEESTENGEAGESKTSESRSEARSEAGSEATSEGAHGTETEPSRGAEAGAGGGVEASGH